MKENWQPAAAPGRTLRRGKGQSQDQWLRFLGLLMKCKVMQQAVDHQPGDWESDWVMVKC
jgi:hypothetical protein